MSNPEIEEQLLLNPRAAAQKLCISERQLWSHSEPRGEIPVVRIGNCVRYSLRSLEAFIAAQQSKATA